jgi:hypothetical protein
MKQQTRKRIFYAFFILFFLIGGIVVFYADGWRFNFLTFQAEKAGAIYVRSYPDDAQISLNGKFIQNESAFLSRGTFISGLPPKTYTLDLNENGYDMWSEQAQVLPSLVNEMKYAVLVPRTATNVATTSGEINNFFEINGSLVTQNTSGTIRWDGAPIANGTVISHSTDLNDAIIRSSSSVALSGATALYRLYNFTSATSLNLDPILKQLSVPITPALNLFIDPYDGTSIILQTSARIIQIDSITQEATVVEAAPSGETIRSAIAISPSTMAWALFSSSANISHIMIYDKSSGAITDNTLTVNGPVHQLEWVKNGELGILEDNNSVYLYNVSNEKLSKLADDVKQFYPTSDGNAVAALEYHSLEVFVFGPQQQYYRFDLPEIGAVQGLIWYKDESHLFVEYPGSVSFLDLNDTALKNLTVVSQGMNAHYDPQENALYLIDPGHKLLRFDLPQ